MKSLKIKEPISFTKNFAYTYYWYGLLQKRLSQGNSEISVIGDNDYSKCNIFYTTRFILSIYCHNPLIYICLSSFALLISFSLHCQNLNQFIFIFIVVITSSYFCFLLLNENYNYLGFCIFPLIVHLIQSNDVYILTLFPLVIVGITPLTFIYLFCFISLLFSNDILNIYFLLLTFMIFIYYVGKLRFNLLTTTSKTLKVIGGLRTKGNIFIRKVVFRKSTILISILQLMYILNIDSTLYLYFSLIILLLYILNEFNIFRFADSKSYFNIFLIFNTMIYL